MSARIETPFTNEHFAAFVQKMVGQPYWYGTTGHRATSSLLKSKTVQYPSHYTLERYAKYKNDIANGKIVCDCVGGCKAYAWTGGGESILKGLTDKKTPVNLKYASNGCPDRSANGMFSHAKNEGMPWGDIKTLPNLPGVALWKSGHVGFAIDDTWAVEWRSYAYGCQKTKIEQRGWKNWFYLPFIRYGAETVRTLKNGMSGEDVKALQKKLLALGYALPKYGADGKFGAETEKALKNFQKDKGLTADGVFTKETQAAMEEKTTPDAVIRRLIIRANEASVFTGNGEEFPVIMKAKSGDAFEFVSSSENGFHAVRLSDDVGWVSGEYSGF